MAAWLDVSSHARTTTRESIETERAGQGAHLGSLVRSYTSFIDTIRTVTESLMLAAEEEGSSGSLPSMLPSFVLMGLTAAVVEEAPGLDDDALLVAAKRRSLAILVAAIVVHGARIMIVMRSNKRVSTGSFSGNIIIFKKKREKLENAPVWHPGPLNPPCLTLAILY
jgi:hypothetical protein